jgi:Tfp pilus assembly protein PilF
VILPLLLAFAAQAAPDACAPVPAGAYDPEAAAAYEAVGAEERAAGREDSAIAALRAALERDPSREAARATLAELCDGRRREDAFALGLERVRAGDCAGALPALDDARRGGDAGAALLAGVCRYQLGDDDAAAEALREALDSEETRASAELYLGLLALRDGRGAEASPHFRSATADPALAPMARVLASEALREGTIVLSVLGEIGWDSNVDVAPEDEIAPSGSGDALAGGTALLTVSPWLERGPYLRGVATTQQQARRNEFDLVGAGATVGLPVGTRARRLLLELGYDVRRMAGEPYLSAPRLLAEGRAALGRGFTGEAAYALRDETFHPEAARDDSGVRHAVELEVSRAVRKVHLSGGWQATWDGARKDWRAFTEHGPLLGLTAPLSLRARAVLEVAYAWRTYHAEDPELEVRRSDTYLDAAARLELDFADRWTAHVSVAGRRAFSNVPDLRYARLVPTTGISYTAGLR